MINHSLFLDFLQIYAFQPATALLRAVEVDVFQTYLPRSSRCLDLGCGDGKLTEILFKDYMDTYLVGIDNDNVETAQAIRSSIYRKVFTTSASSIPEEDRSFDLVISNSVLEHIPDLEPVIAEVSRVLKTDGKFIFTVPGPDFHKCLRGPKKEIARTQYLREMDQRLAHYHYLSVGEWRDLLAKSQMEVREYVGYLNCKETQRWELISNLTGGLLWRLSGKKDAPIQMQRKLGFRQLQNKYKTPRSVANLLSKLLLLGMRNTDAQNQNACLLVVAQKTS